MDDPKTHLSAQAAGDESDPLWSLLGEAPLPQPDGWFAVRAVALCRHETREGLSVWSLRLAWLWRWTLGGGLALFMTLVFVFTQVQTAQVDRQKNVQEAFAVVASIDNDSDSSPSWQDSSF